MSRSHPDEQRRVNTTPVDRLSIPKEGPTRTPTTVSGGDALIDAAAAGLESYGEGSG